MCLIVVKPKGKQLPKSKALKRWFTDHPDGFGMAFQQGDKVGILKGAMTIKDMFGLIEKAKTRSNLVDVDILFHFRLATGGKIVPKNCHPFPVTKNKKELSSLDTLTDCALAHNGIIFDYSTYKNQEWYGCTGNKTDTQEFIENYVADLGDVLWHPKVLALIEAYTESKFALLTSRGVTYIGKFIEERGYCYSNGGYKPTKPVVVPYYHIKTPLFESNYYDTCIGNSGILCDYCKQPFATIYELPDDGSLLCPNCFGLIMGREPTEEEKYF